MAMKRTTGTGALVLASKTVLIMAVMYVCIRRDVLYEDGGVRYIRDVCRHARSAMQGHAIGRHVVDGVHGMVRHARSAMQAIAQCARSLGRHVHAYVDGMRKTYEKDRQTDMHSSGWCSTAMARMLAMLWPAQQRKQQHRPSLDCPLSRTASSKQAREQLGRGTWRLLHTMASKYPVHPTSTDKQDMARFLALLGRLFPCEECSMHFQAMMGRHTPQLNSRDEFEQWMCAVHNVVNRRIGKDVFDCERVRDVWGCGCEI